MKESTKSLLYGAGLSVLGFALVSYLNRTRLGDHVHLGDVVTDSLLGKDNPILVTQVDTLTTAQGGQYSGHQTTSLLGVFQTQTFSKSNVTNITRSGIPLTL